MQVCHVVRQFWPSVGGLEGVAGQLARAQMAGGTSVEIVTLDRIFSEPWRKLAANDSHAGLNIVRLPYFGSPRYPIAPKVLSAIDKADLVHVHAIDFFFDFLALTRRLHGKPLVATTHGGFFHTGAYAGLKKVWFDGITRRSMRSYDAVVACSEADEDLFAPIAAGNLQRIDNGVDIDKFAGCSSEVAAKRLATIGRFSFNKRLDRILDAMAHLVATDRAWHIDIIGAPSDWPRARLEAEIAARQLAAHVSVTTGASDAEAAALLARASFFVSASEHEGFGLAAVEALSAGLIPIVHGNAAYRALKARCALVQIVDFADPAGTAAAIARNFAESQEYYAERRQKARDAARAFAWPRMADLYLTLYDKILTGSNRGR
jgi:alpha-1,3-mannosyltransferase